METQVENTPGIGEWQSKLAEVLRFNQKKMTDAFLLARKRHDISAQALHVGLVAVETLMQNSRLVISHFKEHETREDYAKDLLERLTS